MRECERQSERYGSGHSSHVHFRHHSKSRGAADPQRAVNARSSLTLDRIQPAGRDQEVEEADETRRDRGHRGSDTGRAGRAQRANLGLPGTRRGRGPAGSRTDHRWRLAHLQPRSCRHALLPLAQINTKNVSTLAPAWSYRLRPEPGRSVPAIDKPASSFELFQEVTPIVVDGVMYLPSGNRVVALEPETGKEIWRYELPEGLASFRGVAYWPGDAGSHGDARGSSSPACGS